MGYPEIDKGTPREVFLCYFRKPCTKTNMLTNFRGPSIIFLEIKGYSFFPYIGHQILCFGPKMVPSAAGKNRNGPKFVIQSHFRGMYPYIVKNIAYLIYFPQKNRGGLRAPPPMHLVP